MEGYLDGANRIRAKSACENSGENVELVMQDTSRNEDIRKLMKRSTKE